MTDEWLGGAHSVELVRRNGSVEELKGVALTGDADNVIIVSLALAMSHLGVAVERLEGIAEKLVSGEEVGIRKGTLRLRRLFA